MGNKDGSSWDDVSDNLRMVIDSPFSNDLVFLAIGTCKPKGAPEDNLNFD